MKKALALFLLLALTLFSVCSCGFLFSGESTEEDTNPNALGSYEVVIDSCRAGESYDGFPVVIVKYIFTNNSENAASFSGSISTTAYQDGIELSKEYFVDTSANYSADNQSKEIKTGKSIEVEVAFKLNDNKTAVEVEASQFFSFNNKTVTGTFEIKDMFKDAGKNPGAETNQAGEQETEPTDPNKVGKYSVVIDSYRIVTDKYEKPAIIVKYIFTNNSDEAASFMWSISTDLFQNGIGLDEAYYFDSSVNYSSDNRNKSIKNGATIEVEVAYTLNDTTSDVEVEVTEYLGWTDEKVTTIFEIK